MLKGFNTKQLIFVTLIGTLLFLMELLIVGISAIIGGGYGFLVIAIFWTAIALVGGLVVRKFGTFTIMAFIYSVLAIPTTVYGPPGMYKVIPALIVGLLIDICVKIFKYKKVGYYIGGFIGQVIGLLIFIEVYVVMGFPGKEEFIKSLGFLTPLYGIEALLGVWLGFSLYNRLKNKKVIKQIAC